MRSSRNIVTSHPDNSSSLQDWLTWLEQLDPNRIELGLARVQSVWQRAGIDRVAPLVVTVTGTNGKGSCVAYLENILTRAGYRVGSYTSPHLHHFNERVHVNGEEVDDRSLVTSFARINSLRTDTPLTYFEFTTLAALDIFASNALDIVLLEVGLGGRLDAVNIIDADIVLVTSIDIDHVDWLGKDRESIGLEKAGVFRQGRPVICADANPPQSLLSRAKVLDAPLFILGRDFGYEVVDVQHGPWSWWLHDAQGDWQLAELPMPGLGGGVQFMNAAAVLALLRQLPIGPLTLQAIHDGLAATRVPGRFEMLGRHPDVIADVAHNPQSARALADHLDDWPARGKTLAVFGAMADKDLRGIIEPLAGHVDHWYLAAPQSSRAATVKALQAALSEAGIQASSAHDSVLAAMTAARRVAGTDDRIIVFGSFYTVAEAMQLPV